jgi:preprotein translocase subunit SecG
MTDPLPYPGAPRWVKVSGIVVGVVALLVVVLIHAGSGHNMQSAGGHGGHAAPESGH